MTRPRVTKFLINAASLPYDGWLMLISKLLSNSEPLSDVKKNCLFSAFEVNKRQALLCACIDCRLYLSP
jgi:hypothetical protein